MRENGGLPRTLIATAARELTVGASRLEHSDSLGDADAELSESKGTTGDIGVCSQEMLRLQKL